MAEKKPRESRKQPPGMISFEEHLFRMLEEEEEVADKPKPRKGDRRAERSER